MKKCPQCGSVYTDEFIYCDQDGTALRSGSRRALWISLGVAALVLAAAGVAAPAYLRHYFESNITVSLVDVSPHIDSRNSVSSLENFYALIRVRVTNDSAVSPKLESASFNCLADGKKFAEMAWPSQGEKALEIPAGGTTELSVRVQARGTSPLELVLLAAERTLSSDCQGSVRISLWGISASKDLHFQNKLW